MRRPGRFIVGVCFLAAAGAHAQARRPPLPSQPVLAVADGRSVRDVVLVQVEKAPCLSLRDVQRLVGGRVSWRRMSRETALVREGRTVSFTLDSSTASVEGRSVPMDVSVRWWTGQAYVPLTFLLTPAFQAFAEAGIFWDADRRAITVTPLPEISSPRFTAQADRARVVFELGARVDYRVLRQEQDELYLRLFGGRAGPRERLEVQNPLVTSVDIFPREHSTDVVLYLGRDAAAPLVTLQETPDGTSALRRRLVVEVRKTDGAPDDAGSVPEENAAPVPVDSEDSSTTLLPVVAAPVAIPIPIPDAGGRKTPGRKTPAAQPLPAAAAALSPVRLIVIDPGHGGKDVGAVGRRGTQEKDVNLAISKALAEALRTTGRYEVRLTREGDSFVSLQDRAEFANEAKADLFISVHSNAALSSASNGFEIYFLSERATDDAAAAVARRENASLELEGPAEKVKSKLAQMLLWSMAKTEDLNESSELAALVHRHADETLEVPARGVKQAGFYVLKWVKMPAVLVEGAFITNPKEERLLRSARYQDKVVDAVLAGVQDYERRKVQARLGKNAPSGGS